ncbi:hypothetical protein A9W99_17860 [Mycobacterium sp. 1164966.3]|nr:hypothetical protein A9W99_17860 [Mycobacterium sp. 1164966.3]
MNLAARPRVGAEHAIRQSAQGRSPELKFDLAMVRYLDVCPEDIAIGGVRYMIDLIAYRAAIVWSTGGLT